MLAIFEHNFAVYDNEIDPGRRILRLRIRGEIRKFCEIKHYYVGSLAGLQPAPVVQARTIGRQ